MLRSLAGGFALLSLLLAAPRAFAGSLSGPVLDEGIAVEIEDVLTLPASAASAPRARLNVLREAPDASGRLFVNDMRGALWMVSAGTASLYLDFAAYVPDLTTTPGGAQGFVSFAFHPGFASNGLFYTVHTANPGAIPAPLGPALPIAIAQDNVLTEWQASDPSAASFDGTRREVLRVASPHRFHNWGEIAFDPTRSPGDRDYGLLYIGSGDFGTAFLGQPEQLQRLDTPLGAVLRIDPRGGPFERDGVTFDYGIPPTNPYADDGDASTLGEIYAHGFRNAHRLAWDSDGTLYVSDIGEGNLEEIDIVLPGANYGWPLREGNRRIDPEGDTNQVLDLPADDASFGFRYPVAQYDHDEGFAIAGGFLYRGTSIPELQGHFVFGDIATGRLFHAEAGALRRADDGDPATTADLFELTLLRDGTPTTLLDLVRSALGNPSAFRTDLRFGVDAAGELFVTTKQDGVVRRLRPATGTACDNDADDDEDGYTDFPADPGCMGRGDRLEGSPLLICDDGLDNDADGLVDAADPGCAVPYAALEDPSCDDGIDNDADGLTDFDDPNCSPGWPYWEALPAACGDGFGIAFLLPAIALGRQGLRRRARPPHDDA